MQQIEQLFIRLLFMVENESNNYKLSLTQFCEKHKGGKPYLIGSCKMCKQYITEHLELKVRSVSRANGESSVIREDS